MPDKRLWGDTMTTTLLIIDMQQDMAHRTARGVGRTNPDAETRIADLITRARRAGVPVVHVHHDDPTPGAEPRLDSPGGQPMPCAQPSKEDAVVVKHGSSGFAGTDLDEVLHETGTTKLVVAGAVLGFCVSSTIRDAQARGYAIRLVEDATLCFDLPDGAGGRIPAATVAAVELTILGLDFAERVRSADLSFA